MRIAICDNHAIVRDFIRQIMLEIRPGCQIEEASSIDDILRRVSEFSFDLIVFEPAVPGLSPMAALDALRQATGGRIAVLTGIDDRSVIRAALARGVAGYIPKRLNMQAITSALQVILAGEVFVPSLLFDGPDPVPEGIGARLTEREREVLKLLRDGHSNKMIARRLNLSEVTIKSHLSSTFRKLGVQNRVQAARCFA